MTLKKSYSKSGDLCKVTFSCESQDAQKICVVGDFNDWDEQATPMKKIKKGFSATVELKPGQSYQYRFLINGTRWENDQAAEALSPSPYWDSQNCVVSA